MNLVSYEAGYFQNPILVAPAKLTDTGTWHGTSNYVPGTRNTYRDSSLLFLPYPQKYPNICQAVPNTEMKLS